LVEMRPVSITLEELFLHLIGQKEPEPAA
jgi:hypothetical protein